MKSFYICFMDSVRKLSTDFLKNIPRIHYVFKKCFRVSFRMSSKIALENHKLSIPSEIYRQLTNLPGIPSKNSSKKLHEFFAGFLKKIFQSLFQKTFFGFLSKLIKCFLEKIIQTLFEKFSTN